MCAHYSDNFAFERGVSVEAVVCIACPWMGLVGLPRPAKVRQSSPHAKTVVHIAKTVFTIARTVVRIGKTVISTAKTDIFIGKTVVHIARIVIPIAKTVVPRTKTVVLIRSRPKAVC